jgi:putative component of membrane protein insertase Oxa1/YidC/SpoIIIJ protein YidD
MPVTKFIISFFVPVTFAVVIAALGTTPVVAATIEKELPEFLASPVTTAAAVYRKWVSPAKGVHCRMMPSDSAYMLDAVHAAGPFIGLLMTVDRLHRCGHDVSRYPIVMTPDGPRYWDPAVLPHHTPRS